MKKRELSTDELLAVVQKIETVDPNRDPEIVADYQNGVIVQNILTIMEEKEISQKELAKLIGKSKQYVSRILNEKQNFTINSLALFSCALDCDLKINISSKGNLTNKEFWKLVEDNFPEGTTHFYHQVFKNTLCCFENETNTKYYKTINAGNENEEAEYKIS